MSPAQSRRASRRPVEPAALVTRLVMLLATCAVLTAPSRAAAQQVTDDNGTPLTGTVSTEKIRELLDQREARGDDVSRAREAWSQIEAQGYVQVENLDPVDMILPREIREDTFRRHEQRGVAKVLLEAEYHYAVDQSLLDIARVAGVDESFLQRFFYDSKPLPPKMVRQIENAGYFLEDIEGLRDPARAESLTQQLRSGGAPEAYINALRGP